MESEGHSMDPRISGIAENRDVLLEALDVNHVLLTELAGHGILDERTRQGITSEKKYDINKRFIDWLETRSPQTIDVVLQKLREDKQDHVANLIDGTEGERPLSDKAKQRIRKLSGWLTKNMTTDHGLVDELFAREAIGSRDFEGIKGKPTESARVMELIDVVLRRSDRTMKIFQEALVASNQAHVAQVVEKDEMIELCLRSTCKAVDPHLPKSPKTDKDEELQRKLKLISSRNFAHALVKATNDIIIYALCEDGDERKLLEELFESTQHRAVLLEELIKLSTSDTRARSPLESEVLQLIQGILFNVDHSGIVLQTGAYCGNKRELGMVSDSRSPSSEKNSLETESNMALEQSIILHEQSHAVRSEEVVRDLVISSHNENEKSLRAKMDLGGNVDLCKVKGTKATSTGKTESKEIDENMDKRNSKVEHETPEIHVGLAVNDRVKNNTDFAIQELQLKLRLVGKEMDRKISEITWLHERSRKLEEEKDEISKDLNEILELNTGDRDRVIVRLNQRVREVEKEKEQLSNALKEALLAQQQAKEEYRDLQRNCKHSHILPTSSLLGIVNEIKNEANEGTTWSEIKTCVVLDTEVTLNGKYVCDLVFSFIFRNAKSPKEAICAVMMRSLLYFYPAILYLLGGIPDAISSFCITNMDAIFGGLLTLLVISASILDRENIWRILISIAVVDLLLYLSSDRFGKDVYVGHNCINDLYDHLFCRVILFILMGIPVE